MARAVEAKEAVTGEVERAAAVREERMAEEEATEMAEVGRVEEVMAAGVTVAAARVAEAKAAGAMEVVARGVGATGTAAMAVEMVVAEREAVMEAEWVGVAKPAEWPEVAEGWRRPPPPRG